MKHLSISMKLIVGFLVAVLLTAIVGGVGIYGLLTASNTSSSMYDDNLVPMPYMAKIMQNLQEFRVQARYYVIYSMDHNVAAIEATRAEVEKLKTEIDGNLKSFEATLRNRDIKAAFDRGNRVFKGDYLPHMDSIYAMAINGDYLAIIDDLESIAPVIGSVVADFDRCLELEIEDAAIADAANDRMTATLLVVIIAVLLVAIVISLCLAFYIARLISRPMGILSAFMKKAGSTGDISLRPDDVHIIGEMGKIRDEVGQTIGNAASFVGHVTNISRELESIANGDLTTEVKLLSNDDTMGKSLKKMVDNLNEMFGNIHTSTSQVSSGAKQVADGAQSLAQGATEQAASIQQLSSAISEISDKTKGNAATAERTFKLSESIMNNAMKGSRQMDEMISAVKDINDASNSISKIIKTIDDIAFQTNILALNAAVEAARAGQHGKGFAVVAEEVRNLASKSAEAAKDTGVMIQNSMEKAELGSRIAGETATSLKDIVSGISESGQLVSEIARASEEQAHGISQIDIGIEQVAQVIQQNSATAEQSAAASEEMSSQSSTLEELISHFKLKETNNAYRGLPAAQKHSLKHAVPPSFDAGGGGFGKY